MKPQKIGKSNYPRNLEKKIKIEKKTLHAGFQIPPEREKPFKHYREGAKIKTSSENEEENSNPSTKSAKTNAPINHFHLSKSKGPSSSDF